ncbi:hypothetical protein [Vulcanisaeta distributa]|uniref:Uncharacterized protein n=1 Tax=Vulcanisaeta distributa (strain DSM 14429 / JCM 11212 / NBRC 100878 / IC-017) TaxID=572478 RepID=E1QPG0_VULDI|nr:hypothetical protein [Vulcanisaeta distributa]ADN51448.1 hypothetical protein Vdis_2079 [Vulcanisaeta distributa DSM 14429]
MGDASVVNSIIENAITKVRLFEPNSLIREKADVFVKIHLVPTDQLIKIERGVIIPSAYIIDLALIGPSVTRIKDYLNTHEGGPLTLGRRVGKVRNKEQLIINYINLVIRTLRFFNNYFVCRHVLDHVAWAYDEVMNNSAVIKLFRDEFRDDKEVDKALNELSKHVVAVITDFYDGLRSWVLNNESRRPSYTQYFVVNEVLRRLSTGEYLVVIEANVDYYYLGLLKDVWLVNTIVRLS